MGAIEQVVSEFHHAAPRPEEKKQILYLLAPAGGGLSQAAGRPGWAQAAALAGAGAGDQEVMTAIAAAGAGDSADRDAALDVAQQLAPDVVRDGRTVRIRLAAPAPFDGTADIRVGPRILRACVQPDLAVTIVVP
jgi:hypothetical protein